MEMITLGFTVIVGLVTGLWAYLVFIVGRGLIPAVQFSIDCRPLGSKAGYRLLEVTFLVANKGHYPLVVSNLKTKIRYLQSDDDVEVERNPHSPAYARVIFPNSLGKLIKKGDSRYQGKIDSSLPIVSYETFVQPGVEQRYNYTIRLPENSEYVLVKGMFDYRTSRLGWFPQQLLKIGEWFRLIPYLFQHIEKPHSAEKVFQLQREQKQAFQDAAQP